MAKTHKPTPRSSSTLSSLQEDRRGRDLGDEEKVWRGVAASEVKIGMMKVMIKQKIAFADLEELRIDFHNKIKSKKYNMLKPRL